MTILITIRYEGDLPIKGGRRQREIPTTLRIRHDTMWLETRLCKIVFIYFSIHVSHLKCCSMISTFIQPHRLCTVTVGQHDNLNKCACNSVRFLVSQAAFLARLWGSWPLCLCYVLPGHCVGIVTVVLELNVTCSSIGIRKTLAYNSD